MDVIVLTVFIGLMLVFFFVFLFVRSAKENGGGDRDALLPLEEETPRKVGNGVTSNGSKGAI